MRAIGSYMTKNILILFAFVLLASTSNWVPLYTDGTLTGGGYEDSPLGVDTSKVATTYDLMSAAGGTSYDVYTAILTQSGTSAPTATVLENTLGGTVVWSYNDAGQYIATLTGAFTTNKTAVFCNLGVDIAAPYVGRMEAYRNNANTVEVRVYDNVNDVGSDDVLGDNGTSIIEIRVYP